MENRIVRKLVQEDAEQASELEREIFLFHQSFRPDEFSGDFQFDYDRFIQKINDSRYLMAVCEQNGELLGIGYVEEKIGRDSRHYYHIHRLGVKSSCHHQGIGTMIYQYIKEEARKRHLDRIELNVFAFNTGAKAFYEEIGLMPKKINMEEKL